MNKTQNPKHIQKYVWIIAVAAAVLLLLPDPGPCGQWQSVARMIGSRDAVAVVTPEGKLLYAKNGEKPLVPASTLKLLTADTALARRGIPSPEQMHRQIYLDFSRMEYQIALDEAEEFLSEYPDHYLAEDVLFIRGECLLEQEKYFDALMEFSKILKEYPKGKRVPGTLLRMGMAYQEIGDRDLAAGVLRRLVREYPASEEAATAQDRFGELLKD